jgi:hypothetical protein
VPELAVELGGHIKTPTSARLSAAAAAVKAGTIAKSDEISLGHL